jgi:hypothetical protein
MSTVRQDFSKLGFAKTFVLPALLVFLIPVLALLFFLHAESKVDAEAREAILKGIRADARMSEQDRAGAVALFTEVPLSRLMNDDRIAQAFPSGLRFDYATFRWMIRLSVLSVVAGAAVFLLAGLCVVLSQRSQRLSHKGNFP